MRRLASFLLLGVALTAGATDIWRWKDADGVVHYSDSPVPGAERINVGPAPRLGPPSNDVVGTATQSNRSGNQDSSPVRYTRCTVAQPKNNQTLFAVDSVVASLVIEPPLRPGHGIQVFLNGAMDPKWPTTATSFTLTGLNRGAYTIAVRVVDDNGRTLCNGPVSNFYVRQPSVLSPQSPLRQQQQK
jgi:hypothetical protein